MSCNIPKVWFISLQLISSRFSDNLQIRVNFTYPQVVWSLSSLDQASSVNIKLQQLVCFNSSLMHFEILVFRVKTPQKTNPKVCLMALRVSNNNVISCPLELYIGWLNFYKITNLFNVSLLVVVLHFVRKLMNFSNEEGSGWNELSFEWERNGLHT